MEVRIVLAPYLVSLVYLFRMSKRTRPYVASPMDGRMQGMPPSARDASTHAVCTRPGMHRHLIHVAHNTWNGETIDSHHPLPTLLRIETRVVKFAISGYRSAKEKSRRGESAVLWEKGFEASSRCEAGVFQEVRSLLSCFRVSSVFSPSPSEFLLTL